MLANLPHTHPACVEREHVLVEARQAAHVLRHQLRRERAGPIARDGQRNRAVLGEHRFRRGAVAMIRLLGGLRLPRGVA